MRVRHAVSLLALGFLSLAPWSRAETGEEGWLRYAALPPQAGPAIQDASPHRRHRPICHRPQCGERTGPWAALDAGRKPPDLVHAPGGRRVHPGHWCGDSASAAHLETAVADCARRLLTLAVCRAGPQLLGARRRDGPRRTLRRLPRPGADRATETPAADTEAPSSPIRWVNQWDNLNGTIERGYAGRSIFFDNGHVRPTSPGSRSTAGCSRPSASTAQRSTTSTPICGRSSRR